MSLYLQDKECCGCSACYHICPKKCITMKANQEGFLYPVVDQTMCVHCGLCESVCPFRKPAVHTKNGAIAAYAGRTKSQALLLSSSSGGLFGVLGQHVITNLNGCVYGVAMDSDCKKAVFMRVDQASSLSALQGSKYIQAEMADTYLRVKEDLDRNRIVLFSGTPCQINGLRLFLRKDYSNLYCVDIICHGAPSDKLWRKYQDDVALKKGARITGVNFRSKQIDWKNFGVEIQYENGETSFTDRHKDMYMSLFLSDYGLRESCYQCMAKEQRLADISLGDFWGIQNVLPEFYDKNGNSLVIVRSGKGQELLSSISEEIDMQEVEYENAAKYNPAELHSVARPKERDLFYQKMEGMSMEEVQNKYISPSRFAQWLSDVKGIMKKTGLYRAIKKATKNLLHH